MNLISDLTKQEYNKQKNTLNLIASENYPSPKVLKLLGSVWSNKYGEGYPGKRYYAGNQFTDELETFVQNKALEVFDTTGEYGVNVQVLSGTPANIMVFLSVLNYGDTVLSLSTDNGGHISHMHKTSRWLKFFKLVNYDLKKIVANTFEIDVEDFKKKVLEHKPRLVIIGCSGYPRKYEFAEMTKFAHENGCLVLADIAHINGLVATGLHDTPFKKGIEGADFVSMTTHKTLRGPRGAIIFAKNYMPEYANLTELELQTSSKTRQASSLIEVIDRTIFPGSSGGPHFHQIAATGQCLMEILGEDNYPDNQDFKTYSENVIKNCKILENTLADQGLQIISPTQNHLCMVKLPLEMDSLSVQQKLENIGVITNRNTLPFDDKTAWKPGGLRLGSPALTSRGLTENGAFELGKIISDSVFDRVGEVALKTRVDELAACLNWWYI